VDQNYSTIINIYCLYPILRIVFLVLNYLSLVTGYLTCYFSYYYLLLITYYYLIFSTTTYSVLLNTYSLFLFPFYLLLSTYYLLRRWGNPQWIGSRNHLHRKLAFFLTLLQGVLVEPVELFSSNDWRYMMSNDGLAMFKGTWQ